MRILRSRQGVTFEMTDWLIKIAFLLAAVIAVVFFIQYYLAVTVQTQDLRTELFLQRLLNSPSGIAYGDPDTGVAWPGTIDMAKFNDAQLEASMVPNAQDWIAAELSLEGRTAYYNKERYVQWQRAVATGTSISKQREIFVIVKEGESTKRSMLHVSMITPRD